ncbi:MAG: bifunctional ornithine acetyltransferase/N-acetylglutamate synthase [Cyclobacteriaceae bacterium]
MLKNITNVRGIKCWGAHTGVKSMRRDLAIVYSEKPAKVSATFTQNLVVAAPITLTQANLKASKNMAQALVVNAGNANAVTGEQGRLANRGDWEPRQWLRLQPKSLALIKTS